MFQESERIIRAWRAEEMFRPMPLPATNARANIIDVPVGAPLPWEPRGRFAGRTPGPGKAWQHQVFGGLFGLSGVRHALAPYGIRLAPEGPSAPGIAPPREDAPARAATSVSEDAAPASGTGPPRRAGALPSRDALSFRDLVQPRNPLPARTASPSPAHDALPLPSRDTLAGQSALFACTVDASGALSGEIAVSECAWAVGQVALGDQAAGGGDPGSWVSAGSREGYRYVSRENLPDLPDGPLTAAAVADFTAALAEMLGITALLRPGGLRVRSYQVPNPGTGASPVHAPVWPLAGHYAADLTQITEALRQSATGPALSAFLTGPPADITRLDLRAHPLITRNGCAPERMPPARWPADSALMLSEQFAVNEIVGQGAPLTAAHAPPDGGCSAVFGDIAAAVITERARVLAACPTPDAAFGAVLVWGDHVITAPARALAGFEIVLTSGNSGPGFPRLGERWRDQAATVDYFSSTAQLTGGAGSWAMLGARLDSPAARREFVDRFWLGRVRGSDALFRAGEPLRTVLDWQALDQPGPDQHGPDQREGGQPRPAGEWQAAVAGFRAALARVQSLAAERSRAAAAVTRFSALEQACEEAYSRLDQAQARIAGLTAREPEAQSAMADAEERRRVALADLEAHQADKPGLVVAMSTGMRAGRDWYTAHGTLRASFDAAVRDRDEALDALQELRADVAAARRTIAEAEDATARFTTEMETVYAQIAAARRRWGPYVPDGPSYAETEDEALIELREHSAPWADEEFVRARTELLFAALALHKALILGCPETFAANLAAWADLVSGTGPFGTGESGSGPSGPSGTAAGDPPPEVALAAWQSFFLVVPIVSTTFAALGSLLSGLGRGSVGWLLAAGTGQVPPRQVAGALWRADHAVLTGDHADTGNTALGLAARGSRLGTRLPGGAWAGLPLYPRSETASRGEAGQPTSGGQKDSPQSGGGQSGTAPYWARSSDEGETLRAVMSDIRERARSRRSSRTA
jgi:hypothetical protein